MLYFTKSKYDCTGCEACSAVCPVNCISFVYETDGFRYPVADSRCINCGKCENVCPMVNYPVCDNDLNEPKCFAGYHKNTNVWNRSTSGGAFTAICTAVYREGDPIFGVTLNREKVYHTYITSIDEIDIFRKSKYVQSEMGNTYKNIKKFLLEGKKVIYSGTPCQVAGVKNYLGKSYDNLFCIDLVCHGVGSPIVFEKYIQQLEEKNKSTVKEFSFRSKNYRFGKLEEYSVIIDFSDGRSIVDYDNLFNAAFIQALITRPSCEKCKFTNLDRVGDITIADLKRKHEILPYVKGRDNFSTIIINTNKGREIINMLNTSMELYEVNLESVVNSNTPLRKSAKHNKNKELFFNEFNQGEAIEILFKRYIKKTKFYIKLWKIMPDSLKGIIRRGIR